MFNNTTERPVNKRLAAMTSEATETGSPTTRPRRQSARMSTGSKPPPGLSRPAPVSLAPQAPPSIPLPEANVPSLKRGDISSLHDVPSSASKRLKLDSDAAPNKDNPPDNLPDLAELSELSEIEEVTAPQALTSIGQEETEHVPPMVAVEEIEDVAPPMVEEAPKPTPPADVPLLDAADVVGAELNRLSSLQLRNLLQQILSAPGAMGLLANSAGAVTSAPDHSSASSSTVPSVGTVSTTKATSRASNANDPSSSPSSALALPITPSPAAIPNALNASATTTTHAAMTVPAAPAAPTTPVVPTATTAPTTPVIASKSKSTPPGAARVHTSHTSPPPGFFAPPATPPTPSPAPKANVDPLPTPQAKNKVGQPVQSKGKAKEAPGVFLEDIQPSNDPFSALAECGVFDASLQDPLLIDDYPGLPKLPSTEVIGFNGQQASNFFKFSDWPAKAPDLDINSILSALRFVERVPYVNLARVSPRLLRVAPVATPTAATKNRRQLLAGNDPVTALTPVYVTESQITATPVPQAGVRAPVTKFLSGFAHGQEYQRVMGNLGASFREKKMYHNLFHSTLHFSTIPPGQENSPRRRRVTRTNYQGSSSANQSPSRKTYLMTTEEVPVYDASDFLRTKGTSFDLTECINTVGHLTGEAFDAGMKDFGLERIDSEVDGACAVIAHTVNVSDYAKDSIRGQVINFNLLWVLVLGWDIDQSDGEDN